MSMSYIRNDDIKENTTQTTHLRTVPNLAGVSVILKNIKEKKPQTTHPRQMTMEKGRKWGFMKLMRT